MPKNTQTVCVNAAKIRVKAEVIAFARSAPAKVLSRATGISESRIYDWRAERFGANAATLEVIRRYRIEEAKRQMAQAEAVIRQSLGPVAEHFPDAVEQVLRGR